MGNSVSKAPEGFKKLKWYAPGLLWMLSSVGSGSVLFTPRIGSKYGYQLLWAALMVIFFQWVMIREIGRYTVATGKTFLKGLKEIPGPGYWALWFIFIPQVIAAVVTIGGIAALAGSALMIALPGSQVFYSTILIVVSITLVVAGKYKAIEKVSSILAAILVISAMVAALKVLNNKEELIKGLIPSLPQPFEASFIVPWFGFILAGAAGIMWFSYWVSTKRYGQRTNDSIELSESEVKRRIKKWDKVMSTAALTGIVTGGLVVVSFLTLGAEVLKPKGVIPKGIDVAKDLTRLLSEVWGQFGFWLLLTGVFIALWGSLMAGQDGWSRTFADATFLADKENNTKNKYFKWLFRKNERLKNFYAITATAILPLILFYLVQDPVKILSAAGVIAAAHTPVILAFALYLNTKRMDKSFSPSYFMRIMTVVVAVFFTVVAVVYVVSEI